MSAMPCFYPWLCLPCLCVLLFSSFNYLLRSKLLLLWKPAAFSGLKKRSDSIATTGERGGILLKQKQV